MFMRGRYSIRWKIFFYLLAFCALLLVVLWVFQTVLLDNFYKAIKQREVQQAATYIARALEEEDEFWQSDVVSRGDLYVELWNPTQGMFVIPGNNPAGFFRMLSEPEKQALYIEVQESGGRIAVRDVSEGEFPFGGGMDIFGGQMPMKDGGRMMERESILYADIVTAANIEWLLIVSAEITPVSATVDTLRVQLVWISVFVLVLGIALALLIARRVSKPIVTLNQRAGELAEGNYETTFDGSGYLEVSQLSDTLNHAATELGKTDKLRRELVANVSHDLRTPLTLITGYAEMMRDIPGENNPENMQVIIDEARRLTSLVSELMDLSRLEAGIGEMNTRRTNLTKAVRGIIARFSKFNEAEGYSVDFQYTVDTFVQADEARIAQVVYNFLINAMAHTGPDKAIRVVQYSKAGRVFIEVSDTGEGIDPHELPNIWERYYRVDHEHQRSATGSGLGLSIAKSILEQHPGVTYGVNSRRGEGSTFWFSLPEDTDA